MTARSPHEPHRASTPLELLFDLVFVVAIAQAAERTASRHRRSPRARGPPRLPDGLLRHLVGVDELHLVRLGVRLRRRAVPARGVRADYRRAHPGGGRAGDVRSPRAQSRDGHRLRRDAAGHGRAVAAGGGLGSRPAATRRAGTRWASRSFRWRGSRCCWCPTCGPGIPHACGARAGGAGMGRARGADHLAPPAHRRTIRTASRSSCWANRSSPRPSPCSRRSPPARRCPPAAAHHRRAA